MHTAYTDGKFNPDNYKHSFKNNTFGNKIWDQLNVFVKGIRNKLFAKNEKINICFFISSIHHSILL